MGILIDKVRIANFRAIKNLEVNLSKLTMLVGANNAGKTSFLRALHLALGIDRKMVNREDVHDDGIVDVYEKEIIIDIRIIAVDDNGKRTQDFHEDWRESDGFSGNIKPDTADYQFLGIRTKYKFDNLNHCCPIKKIEILVLLYTSRLNKILDCFSLFLATTLRIQ